MSADPEIVEQMMALVHRLATGVLERPREDREAAYEWVRDVGYRSGLGAGMDEAQAREVAASTVEWVGSLVRMIEAGGAGAGGTA